MGGRGNYVGTNKDFNPGNARWCETHHRLECTKQKSHQRGLCHMIALKGTDACGRHSGLKKEVAKARGEAVVSAWSAIGRADNPVSAPTAVLGMLQQSWLRAAALSELLRRQVATDGELSGNLDGDEMPETSGLIGFRYGAAGKDGVIYRQSEDVRALVALEAAERDRVVKYAKTAHDMGISSKIIQMAEQWGDIVVGRLMLIMEALDLTPQQASRVPALVQAHLGTIELESGASDVSGLSDSKAL